MSPHILMLLSNPYRPDPRVLREAEALTSAGYRVTLIAWDRQVELPAHETTGGLDIIRIHSARSSYSAGLRQALHIPAFWRASNRLGRSLLPEVVHCHDLDTLYAGVQLKHSSRCRLVYDAHENYPATMSLYLPALAIFALERFENYLLRSVDHTITASRRFAEGIGARGFSPVTAIGNYADLESYKRITSAQISASRASLGIQETDLVVSYIGGFTLDRVILPLLQAAIMLPDVHVIIAGDGPQRQEIEGLSRNRENIHYLGWIPPVQVPLITKLSDVIFYALVADYPGAEYNAPNALGNAIAAGCPMLVNDVGDLGETIRRYNCGQFLDDLTPQAIVEGIASFQNKNLRDELASNTQHAADQGCSVKASNKMLVEIYNKLLS